MYAGLQHKSYTQDIIKFIQNFNEINRFKLKRNLTMLNYSISRSVDAIFRGMHFNTLDAK